MADHPNRTKTFEKCLVLGVRTKHHFNADVPVLTNNPYVYPEMAKWLRTEVYDRALKEQSTLFYEIPEARVFVEFMLAMSHVKDKSPLDEEALRVMGQTDQYMESQVGRGILSRRKLAKAVDQGFGSFYDHPLKSWLRQKVVRLTHRNLSKYTAKEGENIILLPTGTLWKKLKALVLGIPDRKRTG